jgi:hypothetical protein
MNFKPTWIKVIVSILAIILWIIFINYFNNLSMCGICAKPNCTSDYGNWMIVKPVCACGCQSLSKMLSSDIETILIPFAVIYIIWSLFQRRKRR